MPKTWEPTKRGVRDLNRHIRKGTTVYTVANIATNMSPYEDSRLYREHTFDWRSPITGHWMTGHMSAEGLLATHGTVYEQPPSRMRPLAGPGPQVAGPVPEGYFDVPLDEAELRGLGKRLRGASHPSARRI